MALIMIVIVYVNLNGVECTLLSMSVMSCVHPYVIALLRLMALYFLFLSCWSASIASIYRATFFLDLSPVAALFFFFFFVLPCCLITPFFFFSFTILVVHYLLYSSDCELGWAGLGLLCFLLALFFHSLYISMI